MKKWLLGFALLAGIACFVLWSSFRLAILPAGPFPEPDGFSPPPSGVLATPLLNGVLRSSAAVAFRGGRFDEPRDFVIGGLLLRHPSGQTVLLDAGFGADLDAHVDDLPWMMQRATRERLDVPMGDALADAGITAQAIDAVILTHAHWDHVSGLADLPGVPVRLAATELDFVVTGGSRTRLARELGADRLEPLAFDDGPYRGFPRSHDYWGDGTLMLVPAPGHTPGSLIAFVTIADGRQLALIGDIAWQLEGIQLPAERPLPLRAMVDSDPASVRDLLVRLHRLQRVDPALLIVPAHDGRAWAQIAP